MAYVADLHIHSRFSRACSSQLNIPNLAKWAKLKGINLMGTGDCLHPLWSAELRKDLKESDGMYEYDGVKFLPTVEVACIYKDKDKVRRIHIVVILPTLESATKLAQALTKRGINIISDGRPMMGMSSKELCDIVFKIESEALIIPAHIWTPWFSLFGSESGYDKLTDCFGEYSNEIFAVETGLSSEPAMNWRVSQLDGKSIVSFSDAHSLPRLGREVTIISGHPTFLDLRNALKNQNIIGTIEFFPEEGKYHYSGHRNCGIVYDSKQLKEKGEVCPVCKRKLTLGVLKRVEDLADRTIEGLRLKIEDGVTKSEELGKPGFRMLVQLEEIIAESLNSTVASQKTKNGYHQLIERLGPELKILTKIPIEDISKSGGERLAEGVKRVREGKLSIQPGYDNTYGVVKIWNGEQEKKKDLEQVGLF